MIFHQTDTLAKNTNQAPPPDLGKLYEPPPVEFTFETIGWTILGGVLMLISLVVIFILIKKYLGNRYRREAIQELDLLQSEQQAFSKILVILKRVAIDVFGREKVAHLHGAEWLSFLEKTGKHVELVRYEKQIQAMLYQNIVPDAPIRKSILSQAKKWMRTHAS
ncbi:DUF4381 domain-containing protein [Algoriphagus sp.]|uniref:DUF4381 domain-containing protein n=1 Tax=Algoriphagus sp. TaxID=1872435 RepID=UPI003285668A